MKDATNASSKVDTKIDGIQATGTDKKNSVERNLLKGITADENTAAHVSSRKCNCSMMLFQGFGVLILV
jgi:hypothetical protein